MKTLILLKILIILLCSNALGQVESPSITLDAVVGKDSHAEGDTVTVGIRASVPRGYHLYANPLGPGIGKPLALYVNKNDNLDSWNVLWTDAFKNAPKRYNPQVGDWVWAYESEAYFFIKGALAKTSNDDDAKNIDNTHTTYTATIDALICRTSCIPVQESVSFNVHITTDTTNADAKCATCSFPSSSSWQSRFAKSLPMEFHIGSPNISHMFANENDTTPPLNIDLSGLTTALGAITSKENEDKENFGEYVWNYTAREKNRREYNLLTAIIFAFIAGLALNLTPCIFPVLGIRVLSFAESARESRRRGIIRSVAFACGIVSVFILLAALAAFAGLSWGEQFQNSAVLIGIIALIFLFALGMFDFYTLGVPSAIGAAERKVAGNLRGDFFKGTLATILATPCGGPFLGALLAWALLQKPIIIFAVFAVMGAGMALPYILLSSSKRLFKLLPKPGKWIDDFKRVMGILLIVFALNLLSGLDARLIVTTVGICLSVFCAASLNKRYAPFGTETKRRIAVLFCALAVFAIGTVASVIYLRVDIPIFIDNGTDGELTSAKWETFTPRALKDAHAEGRNVIVNFTAAWCTNCKLNKIVALDNSAARELYAEKNILLLTADITYHNHHAESLLYHLGSRSVPFLAIFPADAPESPLIMRDIISLKRFLNALQELP